LTDQTTGSSLGSLPLSKEDGGGDEREPAKTSPNLCRYISCTEKGILLCKIRVFQIFFFSRLSEDSILIDINKSKYTSKVSTLHER
jgi:hypothetical protein